MWMILFIVTGINCLYFIFQARYDEQLSDERFGVDELLPRDGSSATSGIFISQEKYANNLLKKFNMQNCKAGRRSC